jgi:hypothetical protein
VRHPAYQLRPNKAVDRLTLVDAIRRLSKLTDLSEYTYFGLGGPYLEDFRLLYEFHPEMRMVSIEEDPETYKRQRFHRPCGVPNLVLKRTDSRSFLAHYEAGNQKSIFWLDYTGLEYPHFEEFAMLLGKVASKSMVKITLRAEPKDYLRKGNEFREKFGALMPNRSYDPPRVAAGFAQLVQQMVRITSEDALPSAMPLMFIPVSSFYYSDGTGMFTLTGLVWPRSEEWALRNCFRDWEFANLHWARPRRIDVPMLSTKERLHLQHRLPRSNAGRSLRRALGYLIDEDVRSTEFKLGQYAQFHRHFPYFMKAIP